MPDDARPAHTIYILSGGVGASAEQVVYTVLAQFPNDDPHTRPQVVTRNNVRLIEQVDAVLEKARLDGGTLVHTLVDPDLRRYTVQAAADAGVAAIDLMGPLLERLENAIGAAPLGQPGLYRKLNKAYFDRIAAISYSIAHDDGKNPQGWAEAEIVLSGVSHVGKTPLSMYLAVLGWKTANAPIVLELPVPAHLNQLDRQRVFGLTIDPAELIELRRQRQRRMGAPGLSDYINPEKVYEEIQFAEDLFKRSGFTIIDVTDRPIETNADEIIRLISARFGG